MLSLPRSRRCGYSKKKKKKKKKKRATFTGLLMRNTHSHCVRWRAGINTCVSLWSLMCEWVKGKLTRKNPPWSHPGPCSGLWIHPLYELLTTCLCFPYQTWNKHALKLRFPANALLTLLYIFLSFFFFFPPGPELPTHEISAVTSQAGIFTVSHCVVLLTCVCWCLPLHRPLFSNLSPKAQQHWHTALKKNALIHSVLPRPGPRLICN